MPGLAGRITVERAARVAAPGRDGVARHLRGAAPGVVSAGARRPRRRRARTCRAWMVDVWMAERVLRGASSTPTSSRSWMRLERAGPRAGAITNGNFPFARLEVARRFAFVVHAEQRGRAEAGGGAVPARGGARRAATRPGGCTSGDDLDTDVAGAQACGMKAVWINRAGVPLPGGLRARRRAAARSTGCAVVTASLRCLTGARHLSGSRASPSETSARPSRTSETSASASALGLGQRAGRCDRAQQPRPALPERALEARLAAQRCVRSARATGSPHASGQTPQRGVRAMQTSRPRSKSAWFHS